MSRQSGGSAGNVKRKTCNRRLAAIYVNGNGVCHVRICPSECRRRVAQLNTIVSGQIPHTDGGGIFCVWGRSSAARTLVLQTGNVGSSPTASTISHGIVLI